MHLSQEAREALYTAGLDQEVATLDNYLFNTSHLAYLPLDRIREGTVALPVADYGTRPVTPHPLDTLAAVKTFMLTAGQMIYVKPTRPYDDVLKLRISLELEELYEKAQAFGLEGTFQRMMRRNLQDVRSGGYHNIADVTGFPYADNTGIYNAVEVLDACVDQCYVQNGTVLACGLQEAFPEAFANIQASNMSKFCSSQDEADATIAFYAQGGVAATYSPSTVDERDYVVRRASDQKILKSVGYMPASLGPILKKHSGQ